MGIKREKSDSSFTSVMALIQKCQHNIPERYVLPPFQRPNPSRVDQISNNHPVIDLSKMNHPAHRSRIINEVRMACNQLGYFQVINHGIPTSVMKDALDAAEDFFNLPSDEKTRFASTDVHEPVRYGTSVNHGTDKVFYWRDFIKHYANPISDWIHLWPSNPPTYKEKMGNYAKAMQVLQKQLMEVVLESLGLNANYLHDDIEDGSQVMTVNCYPSCPKPDLALGMPPHTDFGTITILNQSHQGLEIMDRDKKWHPVPFIQGAVIVQLGDQLEVISNGGYKSVPHRAILNMQRKRFSIASLHSMHIEKKVGPAPELVDEQHPVAYREGSFAGFLDYISDKSISKGKYIDTLKIT
ncbi:putative flavanone 3-dioxygenase [Helianthus annuus]|nr:putative flavanone 3-dioxygenase [Helianthus annuus]